MQLFRKFVLALLAMLGACVPECKPMENGVVTNPITFAQKLLKEWDLSKILVSEDPNSFFSHAGFNDIQLGTEWQQLSHQPELLKAILGHELMHIIHHDAVWNLFLGIPFYCLYRAAVAFYWAQGTTALMDNYFNKRSDNEWETFETTSQYLKLFFTLLVPIITAYFSTARITQTGTFVMATNSWANTFFFIAYSILTYNLSELFNSGIRSIITTLQNLFSTTNLGISFVFSSIMPLLLHVVCKYGSIYAWTAFKRHQESSADIDSALTFGTGPGLIAWLNKIKELFPAENIAHYNSFHPTSDQRIEAIQEALQH